MRLLLAVATTCLSLSLTSCGSSPSEGDGVSAKEEQASYVAAIKEAVPLAARAVSATKVEVVGRWQTCSGGWQYEGSGAIHVHDSGDDAQLDRVRAALVDAGWTDHTRVEGHVSVEKHDLALDLQRPNNAFPELWAVAFYAPCRILTGADKDYVEQAGDDEFPDLRTP
jgi:hypothetical protein